jgi:lipoate-protein ligase A
MHCFISKHTDVYWNLALEEFLLKHTSKDFFFLWRSDAAVVIGKHQNPYKELNVALAKTKDIAVARRLSGGGTVYQDLGNINFTFIKNTQEGKQINLQEHSKPVFDALRFLGVDVQFSERNDMLLDGKKFSGNAEHVNKNRVLHHGTLLFNSDLTILEAVLKNKPSVYQDKTIASVKSQVINISSAFTQNYSTEMFMKLLFKTIVDQNEVMIAVEFEENTEIDKLKEEKYNSNTWIYAYTARYELEQKFSFQNQECKVKLSVVKGEIVKIQIDGLSDDVSKIIELSLLNRMHLLENVNEAFVDLPKQYQVLQDYFI